MPTLSHSGPAAQSARRSEASLTLRDLVEAICTGMAPVQGLEMMLDRLEGLK
jgi:lysyl-tRNA synthetase class II